MTENYLDIYFSLNKCSSEIAKHVLNPKENMWSHLKYFEKYLPTSEKTPLVWSNEISILEYISQQTMVCAEKYTCIY